MESAPREERKVVSVFFANLVDFTANAEQLDPEDIAASMPYYADVRWSSSFVGCTLRSSSEVHRRRVMALFGAPVATKTIRARWSAGSM